MIRLDTRVTAFLRKAAGALGHKPTAPQLPAGKKACAHDGIISTEPVRTVEQVLDQERNGTLWHCEECGYEWRETVEEGLREAAQHRARKLSGEQE